MWPLPHADFGSRLVACFEEAGLPTPHLIWQSIAGCFAGVAMAGHQFSLRACP
jgi:hypothetical protein